MSSMSMGKSVNKAEPASPKSAEHLRVGQAGEEAAADYLLTKGWRILERNWRPDKSAGSASRGLELDIIAAQAGELVFVEVKSRRLRKNFEMRPADNFTAVKRAKLQKAASFYLSEKRMWDRPCRFDLLCVELAPGCAAKIDHFENV